MIIGLGLIGILFWRLAHHSGEIGTDLVFGWFAFLARVVPNVQVRWDGVAALAAHGTTAVLLGVMLSYGLQPGPACCPKARARKR